MNSSRHTTYHETIDDDMVVDVWRSYLREWRKQSNRNHGQFTVSTSAKLLACTAGIPHSLRSEIWFILSGASHLMAQHSHSHSATHNHYQALSRQLETPYYHQICKDYKRTFVTQDLPMIRDKVEQQLKRMLIAYANYNASLGYAQGMNMIAAMILRQFLQHNEFFVDLLSDTNSPDITPTSSSFTIHAEIADSSSSYSTYSRSSHSSLIAQCEHDEQRIEEKAFWCFVAVMSNIETLFQHKLAGYHQAVRSFLRLLQSNDQELFAYFDALGIDTLFTGVFIKWFTSLFAYPSFNLTLTQQLWDLWLLHQCDFAVFVKFAFLTFEHHKQYLMQIEEIEIPQFCVGSQCVMDDDQEWKLKLVHLNMKPLHLGNDDDEDEHKGEDEEDEHSELVEIESVCVTKTRAEQSKNYGEYECRIRCADRKQWTVWKRFSEFDRLSEKLKLFGIQSTAQSNAFPAKSWIYRSNDEALMKTRKSMLDEWMKCILVQYNEQRRRKQKDNDVLQALHEFVNYFANHAET